MEKQTLPVKDNKEALRFEIAFDNGETAFIQYEWKGENMALLHTEVPEDKQSEGYAAQLAKYVLDKAAKENLRLLVYCPYITAYIKKHPEYAALTVSR
jgi:predicted GNAT family acetyltransferase